ncbi:MAG: BrxA/BrxB family bacilliredoxin [Saprospiraceae bacterium]
MYPRELTLPLERDLTDFGFEPLTTVDEVNNILEDKNISTVLLIVNSVCGCAAANARPGAKLSLQNTNKPDKLVTVFAGVHKEATAQARDFLLPYPPSSPSIALFKNGRLVHMLERHHIEGNSAQNIAINLAKAYDAFCASVPDSQLA